MRILALTVAALALASFGARFSGRPASGDPFRVKWQRSAAAGTDQRPFFFCPHAALNNPAVAATLSHPIVADALNTLFRPTVDNAQTDALRITSPDGAELASLKVNAGVGSLLAAMEQTLRAAKREVPEYLSLVAGEYAPAKQETARFAVSCYWKGEQKLGSLQGVIGTRTGSLGGDELVEVRFDPTRVSREALLAQASSISCYQGERSAGEALDASNQQQYHLWLHKSWHFLPLTQLQATRVNAALVSGESPERYLSPTQVEIHRKLQRALDRDRNALDSLEMLNVDRTPHGIDSYTQRLVERLRSW
jgi:hypothetical protein